MYSFSSFNFLPFVKGTQDNSSTEARDIMETLAMVILRALATAILEVANMVMEV